jgi:short-subunit dehydrogenase
MQGIKDKVIVITGASSGIGRMTAQTLAKAGAKLVLAARGKDSLQETARECEEAGAQVIAVPTDTTDRKAVDQLMRRALESFGQVDVWINGAAVSLFGKFDQTPEDAFRQVVETDFFGYVNGARVALPHFKERRQGTLINIASIVAHTPQPYTSAYVTSKAAVRALGESLRMELALDQFKDIHVCTVMPATIDTPLFQHAGNYAGRAVKAMEPVHRPEEVARVIKGLIVRPRREVIVGNDGRVMVMERRMMPGLFERLFGRRVERRHLQSLAVEPHDGNLYEPQAELDAVRGGWRQPSRWDTKRAGMGLAAAGAAVALVAGAAWMLAHRRKPAHQEA